MYIPLKSEKRNRHRTFDVKPIYFPFTRRIKETDVRKISFFLSVLLALSCVSCASRFAEVKPLLKPRVIPIAQRIADQQKWLDQDIASKAITKAKARPVRSSLAQIKKTYVLLRSAGKLTPRDSENINQMLDKTSEVIFLMSSKKEGVHHR